MDRGLDELARATCRTSLRSSEKRKRPALPRHLNSSSEQRNRAAGRACRKCSNVPPEAVTRHGTLPERALVLLSRTHAGPVGPHRKSQRSGPPGRIVSVAADCFQLLESLREKLCRLAKRVLLFASKLGYQTRAFNAVAEKLGVELIFVTDRCHQLDDPWHDLALSAHFENPEAAARSVIKSLDGRAIDGILAFGDRPTPTAAYARSQARIAISSPRQRRSLPQQTADARSVSGCRASESLVSHCPAAAYSGASPAWNFLSLRSETALTLRQPGGRACQQS